MASLEKRLYPGASARRVRPKRPEASVAEALEAVSESDAPLSDKDRHDIVTALLRLLEEHYVHLYRKEALHRPCAVARLKRMRDELDSKWSKAPDYGFHTEMLHIFCALRDQHTKYVLPAEWKPRGMWLPFDMAEIGDEHARRYIVTGIEQGLEVPEFSAGAEIMTVDRKPVQAHIAKLAEWQRYGNADARRLSAVTKASLRWLDQDFPPESMTTVIEYRAQGKASRSHEFTWQVGDLDERPEVDSGEIGNEVKLPWGSFTSLAIEKDIAPLLAARRYRRGEREFGYIGILDFGDDLHRPSLGSAFVRLLRKELAGLPLIIDIRDNNGGKVENHEVLLRALTRKPVERSLFQFRNTPANLALCERDAKDSDDTLLRWVRSIDQGLPAGEPYSAPLLKMENLPFKRFRRRDEQPVVLIVNALSYSASDLFAAGFQDAGVGRILGTSPTTAGGGSNRWTYSKIQRLASKENAYPPLRQDDSDLGVTIRRSVRGLAHAGEVPEDFGVEADEFHAPTYEDLVNYDVDLIEKAASMLGIG
ncbi:MAG TPA: S41 family peptidase [Burkholderiales bacterium]|nr:S41 family peptidase [Burkholderiales bacterium]